MKTAKQWALEFISTLPDDCTVEDIQYHLEVRARVDRGQTAVAEGRVVPHDEAMEKVRQWVKSSGPTKR